MSNTVTVTILDKDYTVACPPEQEDDLHTAARHLDKEMREIRNSGRINGVERIAVMVALNMTYDLLQTQEKLQENSTGSLDGINRINSKLEDALHRYRQLEIG